MTIHTKMNQRLDHYNKDKFKTTCRLYGLAKRDGVDYHFEDDHAIDATTNSIIPGVRVNGTMTWSQALVAMKRHFKKI